MFQKSYATLSKKGPAALFFLVAKKLADDSFNILITHVGKIAKPVFNFQSKQYNYYFHTSNSTWRNERIIEIPIIWNKIASAKNKRILELGNTINHYFNLSEYPKYVVVDKFEEGTGVINKDIVDFESSEKFDTIISISTIEHVGFDEKEGAKKLNDGKKTLRALKKIKSLLQRRGRAYITFPIGYNSNLDTMLKKNLLGFDKTYFMERINKKNEWKECRAEKAINKKYGEPFEFANAVVIGIIEND